MEHFAMGLAPVWFQELFLVELRFRPFVSKLLLEDRVRSLRTDDSDGSVACYMTCASTKGTGTDFLVSDQHALLVVVTRAG